jgi:hypothetical protein
VSSSVSLDHVHAGYGKKLGSVLVLQGNHVFSAVFKKKNMCGCQLGGTREELLVMERNVYVWKLKTALRIGVVSPCA